MMVNQCMFAALYGTMYYSKEGGQYAYAAVICMLFLCIGGKSIVTIVTVVVTMHWRYVNIYLFRDLKLLFFNTYIIICGPLHPSF